MKKVLIPLLLCSLFLQGCNGSSGSSASSGSATNTGSNTDNTSSGDSSSGNTDSTDNNSDGDSEQDVPVAFNVRGRWAVMTGTIDSSIVSKLQTLVQDYPNVDTLVMVDVPGSSDDEANLQAGRLVHQLGLNTMVPEGGMIASGGVDLFLAGKERTLADNVLVGVHSWAGDGVTDASQLPADHNSHNLYLEYYQEIGVNPAFYWYTIQAAPAEDIHWMRAAERQQYQLATRAADEWEQRMISEIDPALGNGISDIFNRYTWLDAPGGKAIHIFAQDGVSAAQVKKARDVMANYLLSIPGGYDKAALSNQLANNQASLFIFNSQDASETAFSGALGDHALAQHGQDLYSTELFVEGDSRYLNRQFRDASYEEVLHLVQGHGLAQSDKTLQADIVRQADLALMDNVWNPETEQIAEWRAETDATGNNSVSYEYLAAATEAYYGLWAHLEEGMDGYTGYNRELQMQVDPEGIRLIQTLFASEVLTVMDIDSSLPAGQTFTMTYDSALPYTQQSRYLTGARLTGDADSHLTGNGFNNLLQGNKGDNRLDGSLGNDIVRVSGFEDEYELTRTDEGYLLTDKVANRDGQDTLISIETIVFTDSERTL